MNPLATAFKFSFEFTPEFMLYLPSNLHVYQAFEEKALAVAAAGHRRYSARTIVEVLRHESDLRDTSAAYKLNDHFTPGLARLFALVNPGHASLFEFRVAKSVQRRPVAPATAGLAY